VVALQGWSYLPRDGVVGPRTRNALARSRLPGAVVDRDRV